MSRKKKNKHSSDINLSLVVFIYICINLFCILFGVIDALGPSFWSNCNKKVAKIEYLIPGYRIGCYLGTPFGEDK